MAKRQLIPKLRDILNIYNTYRDNTMSSKDFKDMIQKQLQINALPPIGMQLLISRYRAFIHQTEERVAFAKFRKDLELKSFGVNPGLLWATLFVEDYIKALIVQKYRDAASFLSQYNNQARVGI